MTAQPYRPVSWSDDQPIYTDILNQMTSNDQWLFENSPRTYYNVNGTKRTAGIKLLTGYCLIPASATAASSATFTFGSFFTSGSQPVVVTSVNSYPQGRFFVSTRGIGIEFPDHRGFEARVQASEVNPAANKIAKAFWLGFIAMGW